MEDDETSCDFLVKYAFERISNKISEKEYISLYRFIHKDVEYDIHIYIENNYVSGAITICDIFDASSSKDEATLGCSEIYSLNDLTKQDVKDIFEYLLDMKKRIENPNKILSIDRYGEIFLIDKKKYEFKIKALDYFEEGNKTNICYICREGCFPDEFLGKCGHHIHVQCAINLYNYKDKKILTCGLCRVNYKRLTFGILENI